jgi:predicted AAA+ superfamily ATPase
MQFFWEKPDWEKSDKHLLALKNSPFKRPFPFKLDFNLPGLYIIRGPRQVGKSSWLKEILSQATQEKISSFYLSCENIVDHKELAELLKSLRNRKIILLDEINYIQNWDRAIKHEIDAGGTHILVLTGSHAHDLKLGSDRMPGRFDHGGEIQLLPMDYDEFVTMREMANWNKPTHLENLKDYFKIGGMPSALLESGPQGNFPLKAIDTYQKWLLGDIVKLGKQEIYAKEILIQILQCLQTPLSLQTLSKKTSVGSHNTIQDYLSVFESCFALRTLYSIDLDNGAYKFRKNKKFYFTDPIIYWMSLDFMGQLKILLKSSKLEEKINFHFISLAEMMTNEILSRKFSRFGYFQNTKGEEIDFISPHQWAIEVKWSPIADNISRAYKNSTLPQKIVWFQNNIFKEFPNES